MARVALNDHDRYQVDQAREALARAAELDMSDDREMARTIGRLEVALSQLLDVIDKRTPAQTEDQKQPLPPAPGMPGWVAPANYWEERDR